MNNTDRRPANTIQTPLQRRIEAMRNERETFVPRWRKNLTAKDMTSYITR